MYNIISKTAYVQLLAKAKNVLKNDTLLSSKW